MPLGPVDMCDQEAYVQPAIQAKLNSDTLAFDEGIPGTPKELGELLNNCIQFIPPRSIRLGKEIFGGVPSGGFKEFSLEGVISNQQQTIGSLRTIEFGSVSNPKVAVISTLTHPNLFNTDGSVNVRELNDFVRRAGGSEIAFAVAGATSSNRDDIEGAAVINGVNVGNNPESLLTMGVVIIDPSGTFTMSHKNEIADNYEATLIQRLEKNGGTLLQLSSYIRNGATLDSKQTGKAPRRFLIERTVYSPSSKKVDQKTYGIINIDLPVTLNEAVSIIQQLDRTGQSEITRALYLDGGPVAPEFDYGNPQDFGTDLYTNLIIGYQ